MLSNNNSDDHYEPTTFPANTLAPHYRGGTPDFSAQEELVRNNIDFRMLIFKVLERQYRRELTNSEHAILSFILDRTFRYNKFWERVSIRQICNGLKDREGNWIHCGVKISESQAHRVIHALLDKNIICRRERISRYRHGDFEYAFYFDNDTLDAIHEPHDFQIEQ